MRTSASIATLLGALLAASTAFAAKPITSPDQMQKAATHIIVGKVLSISSTKSQQGDFATTNYVAEIAIDRVEKGDGLKPGGVVPVRYVAIGWVGGGPPPPFDSGHSPIPKPGDGVRAYLVNTGYNGAGTTTDGGYDVYYKNGFDILH
jgi:hypothetical protein